MNFPSTSVEELLWEEYVFYPSALKLFLAPSHPARSFLACLCFPLLVKLILSDFAVCGIVSCVICFSIQINGNLASSYSFTLTFNHLVIHLESFVFREDLAGSVFSLSKTYFNVTPFSNKTIETVPLFCL